MRVILLGAPGAGKGTHCKKIVERYGLEHLSSGDILRQNRSQNTELGRKAENYMDSGALVPDELIVKMMGEAIGKAKKQGFVLDGFPRTVNQAIELDKTLAKEKKNIDIVLNLNVNDEIIVRRITGRRSCPACSAVYHIENMKPKIDGICDKCGAKLMQRQDDTEEVVQNRLENYYLQTAPVVDFYRKKNKVFDIDANKLPDEVISLIFEKLDNPKKIATVC
jgi:adenylate kinase